MYRPAQTWPCWIHFVNQKKKKKQGGHLKLNHRVDLARWLRLYLLINLVLASMELPSQATSCIYLTKVSVMSIGCINVGVCRLFALMSLWLVFHGCLLSVAPEQTCTGGVRTTGGLMALSLCRPARTCCRSTTLTCRTDRFSQRSSST